MKGKRAVVLGVVGLWGLLSSVWSILAVAQEGKPMNQDEQHIMVEGDHTNLGEHSRHDEEPSATRLQMGGAHHHHRAPILPPEEDKAYSELNHRIAGVFVFMAGGLALLARIGEPRYAWARYSWPSLFFLLGIFLAIRHDPESWPGGPLTFWESVTDVQVLQHMLFTLIVLGIGGIEWLRSRGILVHSAWGWLFPSLAISAALMLAMHKHGEGLVADKIYRHHAIMAVSGVIAMIAKVFDDSRLFDNRVGSYIWTTLIMFIGLLLLFYSE